MQRIDTTLPKIKRVLLRISGDFPEEAVNELFDSYEKKLSEVGIRLERGGEAIGPADLSMHYDLSGRGGGRMITSRGGRRENNSQLNRDAPSLDVVRVGLENIYWHAKCPDSLRAVAR